MMKYESLKAVHTHTQWRKGGSREHRDVVIPPRDLI